MLFLYARQNVYNEISALVSFDCPCHCEQKRRFHFHDVKAVVRVMYGCLLFLLLLSWRVWFARVLSRVLDRSDRKLKSIAIVPIQVDTLEETDGTFLLLWWRHIISYFFIFLWMQDIFGVFFIFLWSWCIFGIFWYFSTFFRSSHIAHLKIFLFWWNFTFLFRFFNFLLPWVCDFWFSLCFYRWMVFFLAFSFFCLFCCNSFYLFGNFLFCDRRKW